MTVQAGNAFFGVVAIGRNEGERLKRCLHSALNATPHVVYVDSGSQDGSVAFARSVGADVVELDTSIPFTAARARNAGFQRLKERVPALEFVQFVDGDCEFAGGWLEQAAAFLRASPKAAVACGRRRERYPERSIYNRLCDAEWNTPVGRALACGGDAMMRAQAFEDAHGFREDLIAGEEPELCLRMRERGGEIWRLDAEMTRHDAAMTRFAQWWGRSVRAGHAFAEGAALHGKSPQRHWVRESRSSWFWGAGLPMAALLAAAIVGPWGLLLFLAYPLQFLRMLGRSNDDASLKVPRTFFLLLGKFPEVLGQLRYWRNRVARRRSLLIEYK
jgi:glycosyltransferase involved in cell wall biosynthesis